MSGKNKGKYFAIIDECDIGLMRLRWSVLIQKNTCYAAHYTHENGKKVAISMHRMIMGAGPAEEIDHIDGNGLNNRRSNLRRGTHSQNQCNQRKRSSNTSGFIGVTWYQRYRKWRAGFRRVFIGYFDTPQEAAEARDLYAKAEAGEFAKLNK